MDRPFVTPQDVKDFSTYDTIQEMTDSVIANQIARAELWIMSYCKRNFADLDEETTDADILILADKILTEAFSVNAQLRSMTVNSSLDGRYIAQEVNPNYTFHYSQASNETINMDELFSEVGSMLDVLIAKDNGRTTVRFMAV